MKKPVIDLVKKISASFRPKLHNQHAPCIFNTDVDHDYDTERDKAIFMEQVFIWRH